MKTKGRACRPTKSLLGLLFVLAAMWYAASTQNSAAVYLLLFALASVFLVSIPHTLLNLAGLNATAESAKPTFAGDEVSIPVEITNESRAARHGLTVNLPGESGDRERVDLVAAGKGTRLTLRFPATRRGQHEIGQIRIASAYPLGFISATRDFAAKQHYLVYPKPAGDPNLPIGRFRASQERRQAETGEGDDFAGVRPYVPGESQRHIDWKAVARGQELMTKQFAVEAESGSFYLDFAQVASTKLEDRLSQLTLWVLEAERLRRPYGMRLPNTEIAPSLGEQHFHRCLRELALYK